MSRPPIHPGEILADEINEIGISASELAVKLNVPKDIITEIINEQRGITSDTVLRLGYYFGTGAELWMNLQKNYELKVAEQTNGKAIKEMIKPYVLVD
jgi:addiction module HigA family antidote